MHKGRLPGFRVCQICFRVVRCEWSFDGHGGQLNVRERLQNGIYDLGYDVRKKREG
jgi:hypothetical protein